MTSRACGHIVFFGELAGTCSFAEDQHAIFPFPARRYHAIFHHPLPNFRHIASHCAPVARCRIRRRTREMRAKRHDAPSAQFGPVDRYWLHFARQCTARSATRVRRLSPRTPSHNRMRRPGHLCNARVTSWFAPTMFKIGISHRSFHTCEVSILLV